MRSYYAVPNHPVLELYVQIHQSPRNGEMLIDVYRSLGLSDAERVYRDVCSAPMEEKILAEVLQAMETVLRAEIMFRWGIQEALGVVDDASGPL